MISNDYEKHNVDRVSITPSGYYGNSPDMIQARENFMTPEELAFLSNEARNIKIWDVTETHYNEEGTVIYDLLLGKSCSYNWIFVAKQSRNCTSY